MKNLGFGLALIFVGLNFIIFNKLLVKWHIEMQDHHFGIHFSDRDRVVTRVVCIIGGVLITALGIFGLLVSLSVI